MGTEFGIVILLGLLTFTCHLHRELKSMRRAIGMMGVEATQREKHIQDLIGVICACILKTHGVEKAVTVLNSTAKNHEVAIVTVQAALEANMN